MSNDQGPTARTGLHPTLQRQLAKCGLSPETPAADQASWSRLLTAVSRSYADAERERYLIERSMDISSREMEALNEALAAKRHELEAALEQLSENEARARAVLDNAADGIVVVALDGTIQTWNHAAERIFGYAAEDAVGQCIDTMLHAPGSASQRQRIARYLATGEGEIVGVRMEVTGRRRGGELFPMEMYLSEVKIERLHVFTAIIRDITAEKEAAAKLAETHRQLLSMSHLAGMAEVATSVLHNVGNVLNSVNVSAATMMERLQQSRVMSLGRLGELLRQHEGELGSFFTNDERGRQLTAYIEKLAAHLLGERDGLMKELNTMQQGIEHMKNVIATQQSHAKAIGVSEEISLESLLEETLAFHAVEFAQSHIAVQREFAPLPPVHIERHKLLQILMNLLSNAKHAVQQSAAEPRIVVRLRPGERGTVQIEVSDNGVGIAAENLTRVFSHGFTTRKNGHGFGLHSSALAAREMGGDLRCYSDGPGHGATFILELPFQTSGKKRGHTCDAEQPGFA